MLVDMRGSGGWARCAYGIPPPPPAPAHQLCSSLSHFCPLQGPVQLMLPLPPLVLV